jgi:glyoxylase-like metal-dependent hydrolase (beta-lactamase superfamily II)/rhodanese-related sulfurtransferase
MALAEVEAQTEVKTFTAKELYERIINNEPMFIVDVRNEEDFGRWGVEGRNSLEIVNIPYFDFIEEEDESVAKVPADLDEILVICAKEGSSKFVAEILQTNGRNACYMEGGINSWGDLYDVRDVAGDSAGRVIQVARPARGDLSFVIVSEGEAAIVDPLRHIDHYLSVLTDAGAKLTHLFDTHAHADHISGGPALADQTGAGYYMHAYDAIHPLDMLPATISYNHIIDGQKFTVGKYTVEVIWFPGHTLGQVNYLFTAPEGESYLFTGDGIFLKSFGRPDLGGQGEAWAPIVYDSIYNRLPPRINNDTVILPAHFSVMSEDDGRGVFARSYGWVLENNEALKYNDKQAFLDFVLSHLPTFPPEYVEIKRVNAGLLVPDEAKASELELGKNICALSD